MNCVSVVLYIGLVIELRESRGVLPLPGKLKLYDGLVMLFACGVVPEPVAGILKVYEGLVILFPCGVFLVVALPEKGVLLACGVLPTPEYAGLVGTSL